jgi:hypothetical protein
MSALALQLALDAKQMSASLLRPEDRDAVLLATSGIITSLEGMLGALKKSAGQPKETVKAQLRYGSSSWRYERAGKEKRCSLIKDLGSYRDQK